MNFTSIDFGPSIKVLTIVLRVACLFVWIVYNGFNKTVMVDFRK